MPTITTGARERSARGLPRVDSTGVWTRLAEPRIVDVAWGIESDA